jgi:hypothetical protein
MSQSYTCVNYGSCTSAGVPQSALAGAGPVCPGCGGLMLAQGKSKKSGSGTAAVKWLLIAVLALAAVVAALKAASWGIAQTRTYDLLGRWRAEQTTVMDMALPIGPTLEFNATSATVLQSQVPVTAYDHEDERVHVIVPGGGGVEVTFTFRFEGPDRIVYEGPLGISLRYRRIKATP